MIGRFRAVFKIGGITQLTRIETALLFSDDECSVYLVPPSLGPLTEIVARTAIGTRIASSFVSVPLTFEEAFIAAKANLQAKLTATLMVVDIRFTPQAADQQWTEVANGIEAGVDQLDEVSLTEKCDLLRDKAVSGIMMAMSDQITHTISLVGRATWIEAPGVKRFNITPTVSATMVSSSEFTTAMALDAKELTSRMSGQSTLDTVFRLMARSAAEPNPFLSFSAAWTALEMFCQKTFSDVYRDRMYGHLFDAAAPSAVSFIAKMKRESTERFNLGDKFTAIATVLADAGALEDIAAFKQLNKARNDYVHAQKIGNEGPLGQRVTALLTKYLRLHLTSGL